MSDQKPANENYPRCSVCGDGAEPGHERCAGCEKEQTAPPLSARTDNWTASLMRRPARSRR